MSLRHLDIVVKKRDYALDDGGCDGNAALIVSVSRWGLSVAGGTGSTSF